MLGDLNCGNVSFDTSGRFLKTNYQFLRTVHGNLMPRLHSGKFYLNLQVSGSDGLVVGPK